MAGTIPARAPLGASTTNRKWWLDVEDPAVPGVPVGVFGIQEIKPKQSDPTQQDDSDMDGLGYKSSVVTALAHGIEGKLLRKVTTASATAYDPVQEIMRKCALKTGVGNSLVYRFYEMEPNGPRVEAYRGKGLVTWSEDGGGMDALDSVSFTIVGQGVLAAITHPEGATAPQVIGSITPSGQGTGQAVQIRGTGFTGISGATGVKFGGTNATSYSVLDDNTIVAVLPTGSAGTIEVLVGSLTAGQGKSYLRAA